MPRPRQRVRLESGLHLDLNKLIRQKLISLGMAWGSTIFWHESLSGRQVAAGRLSADMTAERSGWLRLELSALDQRITLVARERHFGGRQWYFVCPQTARLVSKLWKPPGAPLFASRQTWGRQVAYGSQFETPHDRALSAAQDIRYRLGGKDCLSTIDDFPPKPKWMRWRTYDKIMRRYETYENIANDRLVAIVNRLKR
jgi:hypothetical protein